MSSVNESRFICPNCGWEYKIPVQGVINAAIEPQLKDSIIKGELFSFTCRECGTRTAVSYNCLYLDPKARQLICLIPPGEDASSAEEDARLAATSLLGAQDTAIMRIVRNGNELREKLLIFNSGLDDRLVEIAKGLALSQAPEGLTVEDIRFAPIAGQRFLILYCGEDGEQYVTGFDALYSQIEADWGAKLPALMGRQFLQVDLDYVSAFMRGE